MSRPLSLLAVFYLSLLLFPWLGEGQGVSPSPQGKGQNNQPSATPGQNQAGGNNPAASPAFSFAASPTPSAIKPSVSSAPNSPNPKPSKPNSKRDLDRETTDANISMAKAAWWGTICAVVQAILGFVGMYIIWATLRATQRAVEETRRNTDALVISNKHLEESNRAAREAHDAERRPWLSLEIRLDEGGIKRHEPGEGYYRLRVYPTVTNHGSTPATRVFFEFHIVFGCDEQRAINTLNAHLGLMDYRPGWQEHQFQAVFPNEKRELPQHPELISQVNIDQALNEHIMASAWLGAAVHYESQHSGIRHTILIGRLASVYPNDQRLRFDVISRFGGWTDQELKMETISYSAE